MKEKDYSILAADNVKSIQAAGIMTTLGITSNGKPATSENINKPTAKTNFFATVSADKYTQPMKAQTPGLPFSLDLYKTLPKQTDEIQQKHQAQTKAAQTALPSFKSIAKSFWGDVLDGVRKYDMFSAEKVADRVLTSKTQIRDAAYSNPRIQAILYQMDQEWNAPELT